MVELGLKETEWTAGGVAMEEMTCALEGGLGDTYTGNRTPNLTEHCREQTAVSRDA